MTSHDLLRMRFLKSMFYLYLMHLSIDNSNTCMADQQSVYCRVHLYFSHITSVLNIENGLTQFAC